MRLNQYGWEILRPTQKINLTETNLQKALKQNKTVWISQHGKGRIWLEPHQHKLWKIHTVIYPDEICPQKELTTSLLKSFAATSNQTPYFIFKTERIK